LFGFRYQTTDLALEAKQRYIDEHTKHRAGIVQRDFEANGMRILFSEAESIAAAQMKAEITVVEG